MGYGHLNTRERIDWVDRNSQKISSKAKACRVMRLAMSSYYYDPKISRAEQEQRDADIRGKIKQVRVELPRVGYRPMVDYLKRQVIAIGVRRL